MTIKQAIQLSDDVKPNAFLERAKYQWLNELEGRVALNTFLMAGAELRFFQYRYPDDGDLELLVLPPHDGIYPAYLNAQIDKLNGEYDKYQNSMAAYNALFGDFTRWFARVYEPAQGYCLCGAPWHGRGVDHTHWHGHGHIHHWEGW